MKYPIKTYLDMADDTYARGEPIDVRRHWGRIMVYDSNTVGKDYLCVRVSTCVGGSEMGSRMRMHRGQVKTLIRALEKFVKESEEGEGK